MNINLRLNKQYCFLAFSDFKDYMLNFLIYIILEKICLLMIIKNYESILNFKISIKIGRILLICEYLHTSDREIDVI